MITYPVEQIRRFLKAVDKHMHARVRLTIIGGSAALLQHGARSETRDIDTFAGDLSLLELALTRAAAELGFAVPVGIAAIADLPLHYQDRQQRPLPHLKHLDIVVPDRYDLTLSKLIRASQTDIVVCKEMHQHRPLQVATLTKRYLEEMNHAIGRQADRDQNLIAAIEFMWDASTADRAQEEVERHRASAPNPGSRR